MGKEKKVTVVSNKSCNVNTLKSVKQDIRKKVISHSGTRLGYVKDVLSDGDKIMGILIRNGFKKRFIGFEFIETNSKKAIILNIDPIYQIVGKKVFDSNGKKLGKVVDIIRKNEDNKFEEILIKKHIFSKKYAISSSDVATHKKNVILNKYLE